MTEDTVKDTVTVAIHTSKGDIKLELYPQSAPKSVENFVQYARDGHYNETVFHRVIDGFMIQGGGMTADLDQKPTRDAIENEATNGLKNKRGTIAMARTMEVDSATSQFFINLVDNDFLDNRDTTPNGYGYCVFGKVTDGLDIVDEIGKASTGTRGYFRDVPQETITISSVSVLD